MLYFISVPERKAEVLSVDDPLGKLKGLGSATAVKLSGLYEEAQKVGVHLNIPENLYRCVSPLVKTSFLGKMAPYCTQKLSA